MLVVSTGLVLHAALTFSWFDKAKYLTACFEAGENFPKATVCGWVGALLVYGVEKLTTKVGVLIVYGIITAFLMYVCINVAGKQPKGKPQPVVKENEGVQNSEIPLYQQPAQPMQTQTEQPQVAPMNTPLVQSVNIESIPMPGYSVPENEKNETAEGYMPTVEQRPGFTLQEGQNNAFNTKMSPIL